MTPKNYLQIEVFSSTSFISEVSKEVMKLIAANALKPPPPQVDAPFITRQEVADLFKITLPTVHSWINAGILKPYKIGNKTRFLKSEVMAAVVDPNGKKEVKNAQ